MRMFLFLTLTSPSTVVTETVYKHLHQLHMKLVLSCTPSLRPNAPCTMVNTQVAEKTLPSMTVFLFLTLTSHMFVVL